MSQCRTRCVMNRRLIIPGIFILISFVNADKNIKPILDIGDAILMGKIHIMIADSVHNASRARVLNDSLLTWIGKSGTKGTVPLSEVEYLRIITTRKVGACLPAVIGMAGGYGVTYGVVTGMNWDEGWGALMAIPGGAIGGLAGLLIGDITAERDTIIYAIE